MKRLFGKESKELSKKLVWIAQHGIFVLAVLFIEGLFFFVLQLPQFANSRPLIESILQAAMFLTVLVLCVIFISLLTLSGWGEIKKLHEEAKSGISGWIILVVVLLLTPMSLLLFRATSLENTQQRPSPEAASNAVALKLPSIERGESATKATLQWSPEANGVKVCFFVGVQQGYEYLSELDGGLRKQLDFRKDGLLEQLIPRSFLKNGAHKLKVYKHKRDDDVFTPIKTFQFDTSGN